MNLTILGSTGSVGTSTLNVVARHPERFKVWALTAARQVDLMFEQCQQFRPERVVMVQSAAAAELRQRLSQAGLSAIEVMDGWAALDEVAGAPEVDAVMAAIVGAAGLSPCLAAAKAGKRLMLANKEALVVGAELFMAAVQQGGAQLLPIDSEHSAIFQSLPHDSSTWSSQVEKIILTASGGPFRTWDPERLAQVTPEQACAHPNWVMGRKISVDSATMMNKALEVIEARWLFNLQPEQVKVLIHPQSIIHSMVVCRDQSVLAQLGTPDMRVPTGFNLVFLWGSLVLTLLQNATAAFMVMMRLILRIERLLERDPLTGTLNRRAFDAALEQAHAGFLRGRGYALVMIDMDRFKHLNDTLGHAAGDAALRQMVEELRPCVREVDRFGRLGGEEFCLLLTDTDLTGAALVAERMRMLVEEAPLRWLAQDWPLSASFGIAEAEPGDADARAVLARADAALYRAKSQGRNLVQA